MSSFGPSILGGLVIRMIVFRSGNETPCDLLKICPTVQDKIVANMDIDIDIDNQPMISVLI